MFIIKRMNTFNHKQMYDKWLSASFDIGHKTG